ncbi:hypothetical protein BSN85_18100 [Bradyrhizobium brasilense]|uniref:hypothetical protein n=1 Tax=Bradyrhizobium brasilense TaxID=1419277 RepID=UPI00097A5200|nr:hypothetical protein [Bradyrhizobium brasilense]OMI08484.1 hypothetical protein BSN85_18100 [Bradyrhizobium brasilense]
MQKQIVGAGRCCPECLDDLIDESSPVRVIDVFVDALGLAEIRFEVAEPAAVGRRTIPPVLIKLYLTAI